MMTLQLLLDTRYGENFLRIVSKSEYKQMGYHATTLLELPVEAVSSKKNKPIRP